MTDLCRNFIVYSDQIAELRLEGTGPNGYAEAPDL